MITAHHVRDNQCDLDDDDTCRECGVHHGDECSECGGRGFHTAHCPAVIHEDEKRRDAQGHE